MDENSLLEVGILNAQHRKIVAGHASKLEVKWPPVAKSVGEWLHSLHLGKYVETFRKNFYTDVTKLSTLCNDELVTLLEIEALGHRRRLLGAAGKLPKLSPRVENGTEDEVTDDGSLPLRDPNHLVSGVSSALKTAWRHSPETLIDGSVTYKAIVSFYSFISFYTRNPSIIQVQL